MAKEKEVEVKKSENTKVMRCGGPRCVSRAQDNIYGSGMRVHNRTKQSKPAVEQRWRCTVCKDEKPV